MNLESKIFNPICVSKNDYDFLLRKGCDLGFSVDVLDNGYRVLNSISEKPGLERSKRVQGIVENVSNKNYQLVQMDGYQILKSFN